MPSSDNAANDLLSDILYSAAPLPATIAGAISLGTAILEPLNAAKQSGRGGRDDPPG
jgi:hypothetical protein